MSNGRQKGPTPSTTTARSAQASRKARAMRQGQVHPSQRSRIRFMPVLGSICAERTTGPGGTRQPWCCGATNAGDAACDPCAAFINLPELSFPNVGELGHALGRARRYFLLALPESRRGSWVGSFPTLASNLCTRTLAHSTPHSQFRPRTALHGRLQGAPGSRSRQSRRPSLRPLSHHVACAVA